MHGGFRSSVGGRIVPAADGKVAREKRTSGKAGKRLGKDKIKVGAMQPAAGRGVREGWVTVPGKNNGTPGREGPESERSGGAEGVRLGLKVIGEAGQGDGIVSQNRPVPLRGGRAPQNGGGAAVTPPPPPHTAVRITSQHLRTALEAAKPSISPAQRAEREATYRRFEEETAGKDRKAAAGANGGAGATTAGGAGFLAQYITSKAVHA